MNWLGDSKPNFPAQISEIVYAQFYATPVKGTRFGIFVFGECPRWRHRIVAESGTRAFTSEFTQQECLERFDASLVSYTACAASARAPHSGNTCPTDVGDCAFG
jgi:hypothetical protein